MKSQLYGLQSEFFEGSMMKDNNSIWVENREVYEMFSVLEKGIEGEKCALTWDGTDMEEECQRENVKTVQQRQVTYSMGGLSEALHMGKEMERVTGMQTAKEVCIMCIINYLFYSN